MSKFLTKRGGELRTVKELADILGKKRLNKLIFGIPRGKVTVQQVAMRNEPQRELRSTFDVNEVDDIELQEIVKSMENLISQMSQTDNLFEGEETLPMRELPGLDKQLRSIRGSLKVEVAKKVQLEEHIRKEKTKARENSRALRKV